MGKPGPTAIPITQKVHADKRKADQECSTCKDPVGPEPCDCEK
jgi:hypothetical protein